MGNTARKSQFKDWIIIPFIRKSGDQIVAWNSSIEVELVIGDVNFLLHPSEQGRGTDAMSSDNMYIRGMIQPLGFIDLRFIGSLHVD